MNPIKKNNTQVILNQFKCLNNDISLMPTVDITPYGHCGKPNKHISHGGIKLFPVTDIDDHHDNSYTPPGSSVSPSSTVMMGTR